MKRNVNGHRAPAFTAILVLLLAVWGCGSPGGSTNPDVAGQDTLTGKSAPMRTVDTVVIHMMKFNPAIAHVKKGDTLVWINRDIVSHNVTQYPDTAWASDTIATDHVWKKAMDDNFEYFCSIHPTMKGKVIVNP